MNQAVYFAFLNPGDTVLAMELSHGGHLTHGAPVSHMGKVFQFVRYKTQPDRAGAIDFEALRTVARETRPKIVLCGYSSYPRDYDYSSFKAVADEVGELVEPIRHLGRERIRASVDSFHNPREVRYQRGRWSPEGYFYDSFNYEVVRQMLLEPLGASGDRKYRAAKFDYRTNSPAVSPLRIAPPDAVLLFDGVFLLRPELIGMWDLTLFLDATFENAGKRCAVRAGDTVIIPEHEARYLDGQKLYLRLCRPKDAADLVIDHNDVDRPVIVRRNGALHGLSGSVDNTFRDT